MAWPGRRVRDEVGERLLLRLRCAGGRPRPPLRCAFEAFPSEVAPLEIAEGLRGLYRA